MNYHDIKHCNMVNGSGLRTVIWVSGCDHHCKGCFNEHTWDKNSGIPFDEAAKEELFRDNNEDWCSGVTFSGGDPLYDANYDEVLALCKELKEKYPNKTIWIYTGYTYAQIIDSPKNEILKYTDVLCDGPFVEALKSPDKHWVGSSNQNVIDLHKRFETVSHLAETIR